MAKSNIENDLPSSNLGHQNEIMEYIGESIWKFIFESQAPFWAKGLFFLCLLIIVLLIVFLVSYFSSLARELGKKS